jgi:hypothetical protein
VLVSDVVQRADVGMIQRGDCTSLVLETLTCPLVGARAC